MRKHQTTDNMDQIRKQLLDLMTASKAVIDARNSGNQKAIAASIEKLQGEYISAIVLMKELSARENIPALLRPAGGTLLERQILEFKEALSVGLGEA